MKDCFLIKKLANGFMVHERTDMVAHDDTYVFNDIDAIVAFLKKQFAWGEKTDRQGRKKKK